MAGASDRLIGRPVRMISPTRPSPGFMRVTWTASALQALGGEQLHVAGGAAQIDRADLRHHRAGDDPHHLVEPGLHRADPGQRLSDLAQEAARTADRTSPSPPSSPPAFHAFAGS